MNSTTLLARFRSDVTDEVAPYLWKDDEVYGYMDATYKRFVRDTGGVADASSAATIVPVVAATAYAVVSPTILKFRQAFLASTGEELKIINAQDASSIAIDDYGLSTGSPPSDKLSGPVKYVVIGEERNKVRWAQKPIVNDTVNLVVYRSPLTTINAAAQDFPDADEQHHIYFLQGMKAMAYQKQDAETFDRGRATENEKFFAMYCEKVRLEMDRQRSKTSRTVRYGGI